MLSPLRYARAGKRVVSANFSRLDEPLKLNWCLTYWCQYRCQTCNIWKRKPVDELTTDEIRTIVARTPSPSWLDLTGGEIFLRKDIGEVLEAIVGGWTSIVMLHFPTNGFLTDRIVEVTRSIAGRVPQLIVTVSLDGDQALNDEIRGITGGYERQIETFRRLRGIRDVRPVIGMTLSALNAGRFEETFDAVRRDCPDLEIADFHLNVAQVSEHYYGNADLGGILPSREAARAELARYVAVKGRPRSLQDWVEHRYLTRLDRYLVTGQTPQKCHSLRSSCFIDPWGTVFPCITYSRPLGSLRAHDYNLLEIWRSREAIDLQREIWQGECPQCWTACEAYQTILGNALAPGRATRSPAGGDAIGEPKPVR